MRKIGGVAVVCLGLAACVPQVRTTRLVSGHPPAPADAEILVFSVRTPECAFQEVALVTVRENAYTQGDALVEVLKKEARKVGGDALVGLKHVERDVEPQGLSGTVIRFVDRACMR